MPVIGLKLAAGTLALPAQVYVPSGGTRPQFDSTGLTLTYTSSPTLQYNGREFTTEPVVIVSLLDLWNQFINAAHPVLEGQGLSIAANPRFIQLLQQLGENAEAHRLYLDGLYFRRRTGELVKVTDLPEYAGEFGDGRQPLYINIEGYMIPVAAFLSPRLRKWVRRIVTVQLLKQWWAQNRPQQQRQLVLSGRVTSGTTSDSETPTPATTWSSWTSFPNCNLGRWPSPTWAPKGDHRSARADSAQADPEFQS